MSHCLAISRLTWQLPKPKGTHRHVINTHTLQTPPHVHTHTHKHKRTHTDYEYVKILESLRRSKVAFRLLGLSATPGRDYNAVQVGVRVWPCVFCVLCSRVLCKKGQ